MDKLTLADPSFLPYRPIAPLTKRDMPSVKPKKKRLNPEDLMDMDMDNIDEEMARLGFDFDTLPMVPMNPAYAPNPTRKYSGFELEIIRTREEATKMKEPMYDEDGCPILPDGSNRLFTLQELLHLRRQNQTRLCQDKPKKKRDPKKMKLRKNPPPRKVDIEAMFREEVKRRAKLDEYN